MANLIAKATGNFTTAGTWGTVDTTSELDSETNTTGITTSNLDSAQFTPGAIVVDAVAVKLAARATSPSGTFTVTLWNATGSVSVAAVTVNVSDLPSAGLGWALFKFSASQTLLAATNYLIRVTCSAAGSQVTLFNDSTANNWSRKLRTTTTQAPAANNHLVICNELTGAGTSNAITVTMNNTATTTWGPSTVGTQGVVVSCFGTLTFGTAASTNYYFRWRGIFLICGGGTVNVGASGGRIPTTSTVTLEMDCNANADSRLVVQTGGDLEIWGADKNPWTTMTADAAAAATGLTVVDTTGWQTSDQLGLTPTGFATSETERRTVSVVGSSTSVTIDALSFAHKGTGNIICNVVNLTRNIKLRSISTSLRGNLLVPAAGGTAHIEAVELVQDTLGNGSNEMLRLLMTTNAVTVKRCSVNPVTLDQNNGFNIVVGGGTANNFTFDGLVSYHAGSGFILVNDPTSGTAWSIVNCIGIAPSSSFDSYYNLRDTGGTFTGNKMFGATNTTSNCLQIGEPGVDWTMLDSTKFANLEFTMNQSLAILTDQVSSNSHGGALVLKNVKLYRNVQGGIRFNSIRKLILDTCDFLGNGPNGGTQQAAIRCTGYPGNVYMYSCTLCGDSGFTSTGALGPTTSDYGIVHDDNNNSGPLRIWMYNCTLGVANGQRIAFNLGDVSVVRPGQSTVQVIADSCQFASATPFTNLNDPLQQSIGDHIDEGGSYLRVQRWAQTTGDHRTFVPQGVIKTDNAIFHSLAPSERITPNNASNKLRSSPKIATISIARTRTLTVWVRRSSSGDAGGANYGGNQPRLMLRRNDAIGVAVDTVLATGSVGVGTWEQLSATTPSSPATEDGAMQFYVDCDGTAGWLNVDDWGIA